jgi:16S rRNA (guanine1207-N2)-methyltransferase
MDHPSGVSYTQVQEFTVNLHGEEISVISKPGVPGWKEILPAIQLLVEQVKIDSEDSIFLLGSSLGALAVHLARRLRHCNLVIHDHNFTALEMTRLTLEANRVQSFEILHAVEFASQTDHTFSKVIIQIPKGRQIFRRWLIQSYQALKKDGKVFIAGANSAGIRSTIKDAEALFGNGRILGYKKGNRIAEFTKDVNAVSLPEWSETPGISPGTWVSFDIYLNDHAFSIRSLPGVFSYDHLDAGTDMLLQATRITPGDEILDVGCGYGIIGTYAAVKDAGTVHLVDNNLLAIASAQETLAINQVHNAKVFVGDLLEPIGSQRYNLILSNPPFHADYEVNYQVADAMIGQSYQSLLPGGRLIIVTNRFIRYMDLIKDSFGNVSILKESGKYHVLSGLKSR